MQGHIVYKLEARGGGSEYEGVAPEEVTVNSCLCLDSGRLKIITVHPWEDRVRRCPSSITLVPRNGVLNTGK